MAATLTTTLLRELRRNLLALKPAGEDGFEGLLAEAIAAFTGLTIRLARSGSQFGRDGTSPPAPFAIAMEAKRYDDKLRLETLAGKVILGGHVLEGRVDVWALGATSEVGDETLAKLTDILEDYGVTLLPLDWAARPLPPMAVLLAATKTTTMSWFQQHQPGVDQSALAAQLEAIRGDPSYEDQVKKLREFVCSANVGMDALRRRSGEWLRQRLSDRGMSQQAFGQYVTVAEAESPAQPRPALTKQLANLAVANASDIEVIAVLGNEGVGKTWLVAQWWSALPEPPILVLVAGRRAEQLVPDDAIGSLARLLAQQAGSMDDKAVAGWRRRLLRWKMQGAAEHLRFIVVLDGINQLPTRPWADVIKGMAGDVQALGGLVVVTCRSGFWERDVFPRLRGAVAVKPLEVCDYSDEELTRVLAAVGIALADLPSKVRDFIRNPRACAIALNLLGRLALLPDELTVDRLLLEYWQWRMQERGNLVAHNLLDFEKLLRSHARAWLSEPKQPFDRDEWAQHSGAAKRHGRQYAENDLTEIEEGRFLRVAADNSGAYEFRSEVLPYALGLLINAELKDELRKGDIDVSEKLDGILEEIRGFDRVGEIVAAATGLACLDAAFPAHGRRALIEAWIGLQNIDDDALQTMAAYVPACPYSFLDVLEWAGGQASGLTHYQSLLDLVMYLRDRPTVQAAIANRLRRWLGRWSRQAQIFSRDAAQIKRQADREARIGRRLGSLSVEEMALLQKMTVEEPAAPAMLFDHAAALLMAGRPLAPYASGLFGWALAQAVAGDVRSDDEGLAWVVRLNPVDWAETAAAVHELVASINETSAESMRDAAATVLRLLGDKASSDRADGFSPRLPGTRWRRIETFCNTNPHDPGAAQGTNLDNARNAAALIAPGTIWGGMGQTIEDSNLEGFTPALARFDPQVIVSLLRTIAATATSRTGMQLRQLAWHLPEISPLFDQATVSAVRSAYDALCADFSRMKAPNPDWAVSCLFRALAPHLPPEAQLQLLLNLPSDCPLFLNILHSLEPAPAKVLESRLDAARAASNAQDFIRVLFFASASKAGLTPRSRSIIADALTDSDTAISGCAADVAYMAGDSELNSLVLDRAPVTSSTPGHPNELFPRKGKAIAAAIIGSRRQDMVRYVSPSFLDWVGSEIGGLALDLLAEYIQRVLGRLTKPVIAAAPRDISVYCMQSEDGLQARKWVGDRGADSAPTDIRGFVSDFNDPEAAARRYSERQKIMVAEALAYECAITKEGAAELAVAPPSKSLHQIVAQCPVRFDAWMDALLATQDLQALGRIRNLGLSLAGAYAVRDAAVAARVFRLLRDHTPAVNVVIGQEGIPMYQHLLFSAPDSQPLDDLRRDLFATALDDAALEMATVAAEVCGAAGWLGRYVDLLVASDQPAEQARGITIAGFRHANPDSDQILAVNRGGGFLGQVSTVAAKCYQRAGWARHWLNAAGRTDDPIDFWRFSKLAEGVCDVRIIHAFRGVAASALFTRFGADLLERLKKAAEERSKKRAGTLFGIKAPARDVAMMIRDTLPTPSS
jgi:hypothetical protein